MFGLLYYGSANYEQVKNIKTNYPFFAMLGNTYDYYRKYFLRNKEEHFCSIADIYSKIIRANNQKKLFLSNAILISDGYLYSHPIQ